MSIRRLGLGGLVTVLLVVLLGVLALPALAAAPEEPKTEPASGETATTATLHGVLNPGAESEGGSYQFEYQLSSLASPECTAGTLDPSSPKLALGAQGEAEAVTLTGLEPDKEYGFCIVAYGLSGGLAEPSFGVARGFKTFSVAPEVVSEAAGSVSSTGALLEAQVNPENEATKYSFEYATEGKTGAGEELKGPIVPVVGGELAAEYGERPAGSPKLEGLAPGTTYYYRVVTENLTGKTTGKVESFTTVPVPTASSTVEDITATSAKFNGELKPLNATVDTKYHWVYSPYGECSNNLGTEPADAGTGAGTTKTVSESVTELHPDATYMVCLVATDSFGLGGTGVGSETSPAVSFTTPAAAPGVKEAKATSTPYEATLEAQVNPNDQVTTYSFEYATEAAKLGTAGATKVVGGTLGEYGYQAASGATGHVLTPGLTYHFRVIAENTTHEKTEVTSEFTTPATKAPIVESEADSVQSPFAATLEATVNPEYQASTCEFEYGTDSSLATHTTVPCTAALGEGGGGVGTSVSLTGLSSATKYYFRLAAKNAAGETKGTKVEPIKEFTTQTVEAPIVESESVQFLTGKSATLQAQVNPNYQATTYTFEYATEESALLNDKGTVVEGGSIPVGFGGQAVSVDLGEVLTPNTVYFYRVVATNAAGTTKGLASVEQFTTPIPPEATTGAAERVTHSTAIVTGTVNPEGRETFYSIQYGTGTSYEQSTTPVNAGSEATPIETGPIKLGTLLPDTTYHYRLLATNVLGETTAGADMQLTTAPAPPTPVEAPEQSPVATTPAGTSSATTGYPNLSGVSPIPGPNESITGAGTGTKPKSLTRAQKLAKALKACRKKAKGAKRTACETKAHKQYGPGKSKRKGK